MPFGSYDGINQLVCAAASFCAVSSVGTNNTPGRQVSFYSDGHWGAPTMPFGNGDGIAGLECPTATFCAVSSNADGDGNGSRVAMYNDGSWSAPTMPFGNNVGSNVGINQLECPAASFCAVSSSDSDYNMGRKVSIYSGGKWSAPTMPFGYIDGINQLVCPTASFCAVSSNGGNDGSGYGSRVALYSGGSWSAPATPFPGLTAAGGSIPPAHVQDLVCPAALFCAAINLDEADGSGGSKVAVYSGESWSAPTTPFGRNASIDNLVCPTASFCVVGSLGGGVSVYSGGTWSSPTMPFGYNGGINQLVCPTASFCAVSSNDGVPTGSSVSMSEG